MQMNLEDIVSSKIGQTQGAYNVRPNFNVESVKSKNRMVIINTDSIYE